MWQPKPGRFKRAIALFAALLATFAVGETVMRAYVWARGWTPNCYAADTDLLVPHPTRGSELNPKVAIRTGVFRISVNAHGLRGPELDSSAPATRRIAILGASTVFGYFVSDGEEAARRLEQKLRQQGEQIEVLNGGVPGYNLFQTIERFEERIAPLEPELVVLYPSLNDLSYICDRAPDPARFRGRAPYSTLRRWLTRSTLYSFLVRRMQGNEGALSAAPRHLKEAHEEGLRLYRSNLDRLLDLVRSRNAELVICWPCLRQEPIDVATSEAAAMNPVRPMARVREALEAFAAERNVRLLDAQAALSATPGLLQDQVHFTAQGEKRFAEFLASELLRHDPPNPGDG